MVIVGIKYLISMKYRVMNGLQLLAFKTLIEAVTYQNKNGGTLYKKVKYWFWNNKLIMC